MDLDVLLGDRQLRDQELADLGSLVALQLDDLAHLVVLDHVAVAAKVLPQDLQDALEVVLLGDALHGGQRFSAVSLLDTDVDVVGGGGFVVAGVSKGVERLEVFDRHGGGGV